MGCRLRKKNMAENKFTVCNVKVMPVIFTHFLAVPIPKPDNSVCYISKDNYAYGMFEKKRFICHVKLYIANGLFSKPLLFKKKRCTRVNFVAALCCLNNCIEANSI